MRSSALRVEFVVSGSAFLVAAYAVWLAMRHVSIGGHHSTLKVADWLGIDPVNSTGSAIIFTALFFGAAFAVGALIVQVTYEWPGKRLQARARIRALEIIGQAAEAGPDPVVTCGQLGWVVSGLFPSAPAGKLSNSAALDLTLTAGWLRMSSDAAREVEYRRSNRQIFLGLLPAVGAALVAANLAVWQGHRFWQAAVAAVIVTCAAGWGVKLAVDGARYQEERIAMLLVESALLHEGDDVPGLIPPPR